MTPFQTLDHASEQRRARLAADLARYYSELAHTAPKPEAKFSLRRMIDSMARQEFKAGSSHEAVVVQAAALAQGSTFDPARAVVPWAVLAQRDLVTTTPSAGGFLVGTQTASALDVLRPYSVVARMGCTVIEGLAANLLIPNLSNAVSGQWLTGQADQATPSDPVIGLISTSPRTASAVVRCSYQFMKQARSADEFIRQQLLAAVGSMLDRAVLQGTGASGQPTGLANASGVGAQSGAVTWANMLDTLQTLGNANADDDQVRFLTTPAVRRILQNREAIATSGRMVWEGSQIAGKPAAVSTDVPAATIFVGDWSKCLVALWGAGLEVQVDPFTSFVSGAVQVRVVMHADVAFTKPAAFVRHTSVS
jgi:HK97 family phage major capsid protein